MDKEDNKLNTSEAEVVEEESKKPGTGAFSRLSRELSDSDLKNNAVGRMLLDKIDGLTSENITLESFRDKYYQSDKECAVLKEKVNGESKFQILYSFCLAVGGVVLGAAFSTTGSIKAILIFSGIVLFLVGGLLALFVNKSKK